MTSPDFAARFVVRVETDDPSPASWGSGVLLGPTLVGTCRHAVEAGASGGSSAGDPFLRARVTMAGRTVGAGVLACPHEGLYDDVALLVLDEPLAGADGPWPLLLTGMTAELVGRLRALLGHELSLFSSFVTTTAATKTGTLGLRKHETNREGLVDWYQLDGGHPQGSSGGPVWLPSQDTGLVLGLLAQGAREPGSGGPPHAFAVASDTLCTLARRLLDESPSVPERAALAELLTLDAHEAIASLERNTDERRDVRLRLHRRIEARFAQVTSRGRLLEDDACAIDEDLRALLGSRLHVETQDGLCMATVDALPEERALPFEVLRLAKADPLVVRCEGSAAKASVPTRTTPAPEGGRIVLACTALDQAQREAQILDATIGACREGLQLASGSVGDAHAASGFDPGRDHVPRASLVALRAALERSPAAAVLLLAFRVRSDGLRLHGAPDPAATVIVSADQLVTAISGVISSLRLVVLMPIVDDPEDVDHGRVVVSLATALRDQGVTTVAPRVPLPAQALPELTAALLGSLLGSADVPPMSLERTLARVGTCLAAYPGLAHLGLRLYARAADGDDTRPFVIRPYRGLLAFDAEHRRFYVGREREVESVLERLEQLRQRGAPTLVLLVGPSGVGKSSLAKAGVEPAFASRHPKAARLVTRPSDHSAAELRTWVELTPAPRRLLIVDQLEEVRDDEAVGYLRELWALAASDADVVITVRLDALERHASMRLHDDVELTLWQLARTDHGMLLDPPGTAALRRLVVEPARAVGLEVDDALAERLCEDAARAPGGLPLLELALDQLWLHRQGRRLVAGARRGGLAAILTSHANECLDQLDGEVEREQAQRILVRLAIEPEDLTSRRRKVALSHLRPARTSRHDAFARALAALVRARLVVCSEGAAPGSEMTAELAHDLLLERWDALNQWIERSAPRLTELRDLERRVLDWQHGGPLLTTAQLERARLVEEDDLTEPLAAFLKESEQALRRARRGRSALQVLMGTLTLASLGFGTWASIERGHAREQELAAQVRLRESIGLTNVVLHDVLPQLERHPQAREVSRALTAKLLEVQRALGATEADAEVAYNLVATNIKRGEQALEANDVARARLEFQIALKDAEALADAYPFLFMAGRGRIVALYGLARTEVRAGNLAAARAAMERALTLDTELRALVPHHAQTQRGIVASLIELGGLEVKAEDFAAARERFRKAHALAQALQDRDVHDLQAKRLSAIVLSKWGYMEMKAGELATASLRLEQARVLTEELVAADPEDHASWSDLQTMLMELSDLAQSKGEHSKVHGLLRRALELAEQRAAIDDGHSAQKDLALVLERMGANEIFLWQNKGLLAPFTSHVSKARAHYERAVAVRRALVDADPNDAEAKSGLSASLVGLGDVALRASDFTVAGEHYAGAVEITRALAAANPEDASAQRDLSECLLRLLKAAILAKDLKQAREIAGRAVEINETRMSSHPDNTQALRDLAFALVRLGEVEFVVWEMKDALGHFRRAQELLERTVLILPENVDVEAELVMAMSWVARTAGIVGESTMCADYAAAMQRLAAMRKRGIDPSTCGLDTTVMLLETENSLRCE